MMKFIQSVFVVLMLVLLAGCQSSSPKPSTNTTDPVASKSERTVPLWVTEIPIRSGWAYGVGSAELIGDPSDVAQLARNRARLDLIRSLKVSISGVSENYISVSGNQVEQAASQRVKSEVKPFDIEGMNVSESYTGTDRVYVLMELDREKAGQVVRRQMSDIELEQEKPFQLVGNTVERLQLLSPRLRQQSDWIALNEQYRVLTGRTMSTLKDTIIQDNQSLRSLIKALKMRVTTFNDDAVTLAPAVEAALTQNGLELTPQANETDLLLKLGSIKKSQEDGGRHYVYLTSIAELYDQGGRLIAQGTPKAKGVSKIEGKAEENAVEKLAEEIVAQVVGVILP